MPKTTIVDEDSISGSSLGTSQNTQAKPADSTIALIARHLIVVISYLSLTRKRTKSVWAALLSRSQDRHGLLIDEAARAQIATGLPAGQSVLCVPIGQRYSQWQTKSYERDRSMAQRMGRCVVPACVGIVAAAFMGGALLMRLETWQMWLW
jgi:hypothetical protein